MQGVQRQVAVLDTISAGPEHGVSITEICRRTGLPKGTTHRLLEGLREHGLLVQEESKKWRLGPRLAFWAGKYLEGPGSFSALRGYVRQLSTETQFFSYLTVLDGGHLTCVAVERPETRQAFFVQLGSRVPVFSAAASKALLAYQPEEISRPLISRAVEEERGTRIGTVTAESYLQELEEVRSNGYAKCLEELEVGVSALSAPIVNASGLSTASLSVVATTAALIAEWDTALQRLLQASEGGSRMLGGGREERAKSW